MRIQWAGYIGEVNQDGTWTITKKGKEVDHGTYNGEGPQRAFEEVEQRIDALVRQERRPMLVS